jgi:hypothetical protein
MFRRLPSFLLPLAIAAIAAAQTPDATATPQRVHIVGASVSGGFKDGPLTGAKEPCDTVPLQQLLKKWCGDDGKVTAHNSTKMLAMFTAPQKLGEEQIQGAKKQKPDVLLAVDFAFWFAYGYVDGPEATVRPERFAEGLGLLAGLDMPILLGDLPDMRGAAARMLSPRQIPAPAVLTQLNAQLAVWAKERPNVRIVPLADAVHTMKQTGVLLPLASGPLQTAPGALLQEDRLHATRLGMAYLGLVLQEPLAAAFPAGHPLRTRRWTFEQFVEAAGAEADLELLRAAAPKSAEKAPAGGEAPRGK